ncbi:MAG: hypothetical protein JW982_04305 [Spirochaetes bacterium]|nr:hypothetical protein [Spirochaetota bacterium]
MKYIYGIFLLVLFFSFPGCSMEFRSYLKNNTDKIIVSFYSEHGSSNKVRNIIIINNKNRISEIIDGISFRPAPYYKCGYTGRLDFYSGSDILIEDGIEFNLSDECRHAVFSYGSSIYSKKISTVTFRYLKQMYDMEF